MRLQPRHLLAGVLIALPLGLAAVTLPYSFSNGTVADASQMNQNFTALSTAIDTAVANDRAGLFPRNAATTTRTSCNDILGAGESTGSGVYYVRPASTTYLVHCDMTTLSGGWTLVMNVHPGDGNIASFTNTVFWQGNAEYGEMGAHFTNDYKSPAAYELSASAVLVQVAKPGPIGSVLGWKAWSMPARTFDAIFDLAANTQVTTAVLGSETSQVYAYEALVKNGTHLLANRLFNPNNDRVRLGTSGLTAAGDDNQPGLGTQMNESICGVGNNCYRFRDVELWVNSATNLWATPAAEGSFGWIGNDGGCGGSCDDSEQNKNGQYPRLWTYHLYVR